MQVEATTVRCIDCAHYRMKDAGQMGRLGFGLCAKSTSTAMFESSTYPRQCPMFGPAAENVKAARLDWLNGCRG